jgi:hypothetical protein
MSDEDLSRPVKYKVDVYRRLAGAAIFIFIRTEER